MRRRCQFCVRDPQPLLLLPLLARAHRHRAILQTMSVDTSDVFAYESRLAPRAAKPGQWKKKPGFWKRLFSRGSDVKKRVPSGLADEIRKCVSDGGGDRDRLTKLIERCKAYDDGLSTLSEARRVCNRRWHALAKDLDDAIKAWQPPTVPTAERPSPTPTTTAPQSPRNASSQQRWFAAVESGDVEEVKSLIAAGTNVNMKNDDGRTALHLAVLEGTYAAAPLVSALLVGGADKDARQKEGWTPLHLAVANYRIAAVSALLAFKAQTEVWDEVGNTPLHMAAHEDHGLIEIGRASCRERG